MEGEREYEALPPGLGVPAEDILYPLSDICGISRVIPCDYLMAFRNLAAASESKETCPHTTDTVSGRCFHSRLRNSSSWLLAVDGFDGECKNESRLGSAWLLMEASTRSSGFIDVAHIADAQSTKSTFNVCHN